MSHVQGGSGPVSLVSLGWPGWSGWVEIHSGCVSCPLQSVPADRTAPSPCPFTCRMVIAVVLAAAWPWLTRAQPGQTPPSPRGETARLATCVLQVAGHQADDSAQVDAALVSSANLRCSGGPVVMARNESFLGRFKQQFVGVSLDNRCAMPGCWLTVCGDTHVTFK